MNKTINIMLGIIIILLLAISIWGGLNLKEIKEKVNSVKNSITVAQDSIKETIGNINRARKEIIEAEKTIEKANADLAEAHYKLGKELNRMKDNMKLLEGKRKTSDDKIARIKNIIPGDEKILKEPEYQKLGAVK